MADRIARARIPRKNSMAAGCAATMITTSAPAGREVDATSSARREATTTNTPGNTHETMDPAARTASTIEPAPQGHRNEYRPYPSTVAVRARSPDIAPRPHGPAGRSMLPTGALGARRAGSPLSKTLNSFSVTGVVTRPCSSRYTLAVPSVLRVRRRQSGDRRRQRRVREPSTTRRPSVCWGCARPPRSPVAPGTSRGGGRTPWWARRRRGGGSDE